MSRAARYLIAQHVDDLFRNEPRNIGVFVEIDNQRSSRFLGETVPGKLDGRFFKNLQYPDVYRQWVEYWNRTLSGTSDPVEILLQTSGHHYRVVDGGQVDGIGNDSVHDVAAFLFTSLVGSGSLGDAIGGEDVETVTPKLQKDVSEIFGQKDILRFDESQPARVKNPVRENIAVAGRTVTHTVAFFQQNGHPVVMETIDLTTKGKTQRRDHAGWIAYAFGDIRAKRADAETIAIARFAPDAAQDDSEQYALEVLKDSKVRIVNWLSDEDRAKFVQERIEAANG